MTANEARKAFLYDADTGALLWRVRPANSVKIGSIAGSLSVRGYRHIKYKGKMYYGHRIIWLIVYGEWPGREIDHINGGKDDNRLDNLREVTHQENAQNFKKQRGNTSGATGVYWKKGNGKWCAQIGLNLGTIYLGLYDSFFDAVCARKSAELKHNFHENHGV